MAADIFVWFEGSPVGFPPLPGETQDPAFKTRNAFEIQSFSVEVENPTSVGSSGGGAGTGKAKLNEMTLLKPVGAASPGLFRVLATGGHFTKAVIAVRTSNRVYLMYTLKTVFVSRIRTVGNQGEVPLEEVSLAYGALQIAYAPQLRDGTLGPPIIGGWDQVTNTEPPVID